MTQEKNLLLKDLCTRLPYGVKAKITEEGVLSYDSEIGVIVGKEHIDNDIFILQSKNDSWCLTAISEFVPYLRSMSSMTAEEKEELKREFGAEMRNEDNGRHTEIYGYVMVYHNFNGESWYIPFEAIDWLNAHHFDYRELIPIGLALEAPEKMY